MKQRLEIPLILRRVRVDGPDASREIDMILDTGAMYTAISCFMGYRKRYRI